MADDRAKKSFLTMIDMLRKLLSINNAFIFIVMIILSSCRKDRITDTITTERQLHGKYAIVSAIASKAVDINLDGKSGTDALAEIPALKDSYLELIVRGNTTEGVFSQFWQNQYFVGVVGRPVNYEPSIQANFMNQATVASFKIDAEKKNLLLYRSSHDTAFPLPLSVEIVSGVIIKIRHSKEIFTPEGWTTVTFEVIYKRISSNI